MKILTYRCQERIKQILDTAPEVHVVRQLGAEDRDVGEWTGQGDGRRTVQSARIESYVGDTCSKSSVECMEV